MGLRQALAGYFTLDSNVNKLRAEDKETQEGVYSDFLPELKINTPDEELAELAKKWEKNWKSYYDKELKPRQDRCEKYYLGKKDNASDFVDGNTKPDSDNLIFEALETFLPVATSRNPEPTVYAGNDIEGFKLSNKVTKILSYLADRQTLKLKGKQVTRNWALYFLGVGKIGWSSRENDITLSVVRTQRLILDPEASIDVNGKYNGEYIGEIKTETAENLIARFPNKKKFFEEQSQGKLGTSLNYTEWWTDRMLFWTYKNEVLDKVRNPHWNYDEETTRTDVDEYGIETEVAIAVPGKNHFNHPEKPYVFLSVFNLGKRPHDETSLIEQNLKNQDIIDKRGKQIDDNIDNINGGWVISLANAGIDKDQAARLARSLQKGGVAVIPAGNPDAAIRRMVGTGLPADVYNSQIDARNELRGIFGITGLTPQGTQQEDTVRGKIITKGQDSTRIGGGITEYLEQWYDQVFNWWVQMMYVYYDDAHTIPVLGEEASGEYDTIINSEMDKNLTVSVKEGSLIPKDELTRSNQAVDLLAAGKIDPLTAFEMMDLPNPVEILKRLITWQTNPAGLIGGQPAASIPPGAPAAPVEGQIPVPEGTPQPDILNQVPIQ